MLKAPSGQRTAGSVHAALIAVQLWFASLSTAAKVVLRELPPRGLIAARSSAAALVFLCLWLWRRERVSGPDLARIAVHALFGITLNQLLFIEGLERSTATNAVVLGASIPVFTVAVALLLGRERATPLKLAGLLVALCGALTVTGAARFRGGGTVFVGNLMILANSLSFSIYLVISRDVLSRYRASTVIAFTFLFGALGVLPFGVVDLSRAAPQLHARTWALLGYIVLFPSVGTYLFNAWALARVESSQVAIYIYLQPLLGAALAAWLLGERPTVGTVCGGLLIFAGIWLVGMDARRRHAARRRARELVDPAR